MIKMVVLMLFCIFYRYSFWLLELCLRVENGILKGIGMLIVDKKGKYGVDVWKGEVGDEVVFVIEFG